jgi:hypothetical protein
MTKAKMNPEKLRKQLLKIVTDTCDADMCPACVVAELAELAQAVIAAAGLTADDLKAHGVEPLSFHDEHPTIPSDHSIN